MDDYRRAEEFFLKHIDIDKLFTSVKKTDYIFLHYIKQGEQMICGEKGCYLADLSRNLEMAMPEISKAIGRLQDKGYLSWKTDSEKGITYVTLSAKAVEMMHDEMEKIAETYRIMQEEIPKEDFQATVRTMKKISEIIRRGSR